MSSQEPHTHSHAHGHGPAAPVSRHLRKVIAAVLIPFAAAVVVGLAVLWPGGAPSHKPSGVGFDQPTGTGAALCSVSARLGLAFPVTCSGWSTRART